MRYRQLGKTGLKVSVVGVGTWQFGGQWSKDFTQEDVVAILTRAKELGVNLIDTSACYGPDHMSERLIGGFLKDNNREDWIIATKFGHMHGGWTPQAVRQTLDDSLRTLGTDHVDIYQFHSGSNEAFDTPGLWEMLAGQVEAGKVRFLGNSVGSNDNIRQVAASADRGISTIQIIYNRIDRTPEKEVFASCRAQDLGVLARVPLASGFLSGKYRPDAKFAAGDIRAERDPERVRRQIEEAARIKETEVPEGVDMATWALAWCVRHPAVSCAIPGCKSVQQVESNAAAADLAEMVRDDHPQAWRG
jgi:aryl-alcohol dehydrogenase-like predicted oxidoreductase